MTRQQYVENITLLARLYERKWLTFEQFKKLRLNIKEQYENYDTMNTGRDSNSKAMKYSS